MSGGGGGREALEETGTRLAEMLRQALAVRRERRRDALSTDAAERVDVAHKSDLIKSDDEQGALI